MPLPIPKFIKTAFAKAGPKAEIPEESGAMTGRAGYSMGFPPITMASLEAGGIPPDGRDMNGILYDLSLALQYVQAGKDFPFDQTFATAIGGYAVGAIVSDAVNSTLWINGVLNNTQPPSVVNGWSNFIFGDPTETVRGIPYVATQVEVVNSDSDSKIVTPRKLRFGFSAQIERMGFICFPSWLGGLIINWGVYSIADMAGTIRDVVKFQKPFTSTTNSPVVVITDDSDQALIRLAAVDRSNTQFAIFATEPDVSVATHTFNWIAIGK